MGRGGGGERQDCNMRKSSSFSRFGGAACRMGGSQDSLRGHGGQEPDEKVRWGRRRTGPLGEVGNTFQQNWKEREGEVLKREKLGQGREEKGRLHGQLSASGYSTHVLGLSQPSFLQNACFSRLPGLLDAMSPPVPR